MDIVRHPDFLEYRIPEFFDLDPRIDNLSRLFSASQPGLHHLLLNLEGRAKTHASRDQEEIGYFCRALVAALQSTCDEIEVIGFLVSRQGQEELVPYVQALEGSGYQTRLFTNRHRAEGWLSR